MFQRKLDLPKNNSFFLFGARGTGKSTLLKNTSFLKSSLYIDLLSQDSEEKYALNKDLLIEQAQALNEGDWITIDEVQKIPKLLDIVHKVIEENHIRFALSGSSARKLKRGGANLLAGRAFVFYLFPLTHQELGPEFNLESTLQWGTLPKIYQQDNAQDKARFLKAYTQTYLKEEIQVEQLIRNLDPFRLFLQIASQMDCEIINYSNIAKDTGVDHKTIQSYYEILQDTHLGFFLHPYSKSVRKVQIKSPKFYLFDLGVKRSLANQLQVPLRPGSSAFGLAFENWVINELHRINTYRELDYQLSFLRTKDNAEIDLIITRPGNSTMLVEIKSSDRIDSRHLTALQHFESDFPKAELICISRVKTSQKVGNIWVLPWQEFFKNL
jgi:uncharacterized protein